MLDHNSSNLGQSAFLVVVTKHLTKQGMEDLFWFMISALPVHNL
jgi:hypothetical protein